MSMPTIPLEEEERINSEVIRPMSVWARTRSAEAEQLALDSARLMACTSDRLDYLKNQSFFERCWNHFIGKVKEMEWANNNDLIKMQRTAFLYISMLQEEELLMAHSLLSLKNNLISLAAKEEESRNFIAILAERTLNHFAKLESEFDEVKITVKMSRWIQTLRQREYCKSFPTDYMRLFKIVMDFYQIKKDNWDFDDRLSMKEAMCIVDLIPDQKVSLSAFIDKLIDEIQDKNVGFRKYSEAINIPISQSIEDYSKFVIDNISSPVFVSMHGLKKQYIDRLDVVEILQDELHISAYDALKRILHHSILNMNVDMKCEFSLFDIAIEILECLNLSEKLLSKCDDPSGIDMINEIPDYSPVKEPIEKSEGEDPQLINISDYSFDSWNKYEKKLSSSIEKIDAIFLWQDRCFCANKGIIWHSSDMKNWMVCEELQDVGTSGRFFCSEKYIYYTCYSQSSSGLSVLFSKSHGELKIFRSADGINWKPMVIPSAIAGKPIQNCINIFSTDAFSLYACRYHGNYCVPKRIEIFDLNIYNSKEDISFDGGILFYRFQNEPIQEINWGKDYQGYSFMNIVECGEKFFAWLMDYQNVNSSIILCSADGISWNRVNNSSLENVKINDIFSFDNKLLIKSDSVLYLYNPEDTSVNLIELPDRYNLIKTSMRNVAICIDNYNNLLCVSNNLSKNQEDWKKLEIPCQITEEIFMNKNMIVFSEEHKLVHWMTLGKR